MKNLIFIIIFFTQINPIFSQSIYFPPLIGKTWDTVSVQQLGWCADKVDSLYGFLAQKNTRAFLVLKDGKMVMEKYFGTFTQDSFWYWASAGKTLTGMLVGIAQHQNLLKITDTSSKYLGVGWTDEPLTKEQLITIRHQLTMSSGLDDAVQDNDCTIDSCLRYKADAGTRWAYHNAPYTILDQVIATASGQTFSQYFNTNIRNKIGMNGFWYKPDFNNVYYSNPRSMARYGLLLLNKGIWNGTPVLNDSNYFNQMINTSQNINLSYGYLTWLNGKNSFMAPGTQIVFPGYLCVDAPADMFAALGKNGQIINVVPSQNLVVVRMGDSPTDLGAVPITFNNDMWKYLNKVICKSTWNLSLKQVESEIKLYPNPSNSFISLNVIQRQTDFRISIMNLNGEILLSTINENSIDISALANGYYIACIESEKVRVYRKIVKQ
ncbi:MAG: serine hydrolase [Bacteroidota bacterium]|nr:serine hydrolase [Bacteroidota bacterium]